MMLGKYKHVESCKINQSILYLFSSLIVSLYQQKTFSDEFTGSKDLLSSQNDN